VPCVRSKKTLRTCRGSRVGLVCTTRYAGSCVCSAPRASWRRREHARKRTMSSMSKRVPISSRAVAFRYRRLRSCDSRVRSRLSIERPRQASLQPPPLLRAAREPRSRHRPPDALPRCRRGRVECRRIEDSPRKPATSRNGLASGARAEHRVAARPRAARHTGARRPSYSTHDEDPRDSGVVCRRCGARDVWWARVHGSQRRLRSPQYLRKCLHRSAGEGPPYLLFARGRLVGGRRHGVRDRWRLWWRRRSAGSSHALLVVPVVGRQSTGLDVERRF